MTDPDNVAIKHLVLVRQLYQRALVRAEVSYSPIERMGFRWKMDSTE